MRKPLLRTLLFLLCAALIFTGAAFSAAAETDPPREDPPVSDETPSGTVTDPEEPSSTNENPSSEPEEPACKTTGEHTPGAWTFDGKGSHTAVCEACGETLTEACKYPSPAVYTPDGGGKHFQTCAVCGGKKTEACVYGAAVTAKPTQDKPGTSTKTCTLCGWAKVTETAAPESTREKSKLMGDGDGSGKVETDDARAILRAAISLTAIKTKLAAYADLTEDGRITTADARMALRIAIETEAPRRHQIQYEIKKTPTCTDTGEVTWKCAYCDFGETLTVPENGHKWKAATATAARRCTVCGVTFTGWQKLDGHDIYYNADGTVTKGRSLLNTTYNGKKAWWYLNNGVPDPTYRGTITAEGKDWIITAGTAYQVKTEADRTLYRAFGEVAKATTPEMTKAEKLRACFLYCKKHYPEIRPRTPHYLGVDWPIIYANDMFVGRGGNCCSYAAAFAFMAKAIGYENVYCCNSGGHGWAEINGNVFDPEWSKRNGLNAVTYYDLSYNTRTDVRYKEAISAMLPWMHVKI
jgi:hypothetical protein